MLIELFGFRNPMTITMWVSLIGKFGPSTDENYMKRWSLLRRFRILLFIPCDSYTSYTYLFATMYNIRLYDELASVYAL